MLSRWYPETLAQRIAEIERHADRLTFLEGDGARLLDHLLTGMGRQAAVFLDPPYTAQSGKRAGHRLYSHNTVDHATLFDTLARRDVSFLMTYDAAPEIADLVHKNGFYAVRVAMKNAHHNLLPELVITRGCLFA